MKDALPQKSNKIECGIINLENTDQSGSHWVAYYKNNDKKNLFRFLRKRFSSKRTC
jgi:hypothetical protein